MQICHPATAEEALALAAGPEAFLVAGGTLLQLDWAQGLPQPRVLVDLGRLAPLHGISRSGEGFRFGALTPLAVVEKDSRVLSELPMLAAAVATVAAPTIRNLGTIGGNVAGRKGCLLPALLALDAKVKLLSPAGHETVPLSQWLARVPGQAAIIEAIVVSPPSPDARWTCRKIGYRAAFTPSVIGVAGLIDIAEGGGRFCRLAVGGGPVKPARLPHSEKLACADAPDWAEIRSVVERETDARDDAFRSGRYRRAVAANALVHGLGGILPGRDDQKKRALPPVAAAPDGEIVLGRLPSGEKWHIRPDGPDKVAGRFTYLTDMRVPDMLVGRILRAGIPHARIVDIDTSAAEAVPGIAAVVTHRDVRGSNRFGIVVQDQPALCSDKVRYVGDAVAAVAACDAATAARALERIKVRYEPLPVVSDPERALEPHSPEVHAGGNLQRAVDFSRGDTDRAFARAAHVVEATYETPRQMHTFMETEGGYAYMEGDILHVCAGGQHGRRDRMQLARMLDMPEENIRIVSSPTGGAFGGKDELTVQPALALLALKAVRPVRLQLERAESVLAGTRSAPMRIRMRTACDSEGRLLAQEVDLVADAGAYASLSPAVVETALEHAGGPYEIPNIRARGRLAYTNNGTCGAFRGFGCNQMSYAVDCQIDRLAKKCGLDPITIRRRNLRRPGTPGYLGQAVAPTERLEEMLDAAASDPIWAMPRGPTDDGAEIVGVGMGMNYQGNGLGTLPPDPGGGLLRLAPDGAVEALFGLDEMGQGLHAAIRNTVSAELGCGLSDVRPVTGDTGIAPESGSTTAARGTYVVWRVIRETAPGLAKEIIGAAVHLLGRAADTITIVPGGLAERGSNSGKLLLSFAELAEALPSQALPSAETRFEFPKSDYFEGNARLIFAFGATLARVAVDRVTGQVRVLNLVQHTAAGPVLDHAAYLGQIEGASMQGLGFTTTENALMNEGRYLTGNLDTYLVPSIQDAPRTMRTLALEALDADDTFGPRGIGELGIGAVAPAIANGVADAIGIWPEKTPIDPERLLDAMASRQ
jgi:xanthine dehydrogenase D subunit